MHTHTRILVDPRLNTVNQIFIGIGTASLLIVISIYFFLGVVLLWLVISKGKYIAVFFSHVPNPLLSQQKEDDLGVGTRDTC